MQIETRITLKAGKDRPIRQRHHWIFSGAVQELPLYQEGDAAEVYTCDGQKLGIALLNKGGTIVGQMIAFGSESVEEALERRIREAFALRKTLFDPSITNAFRLINMEGDGIPGLIVDVYNGVFVLQISTCGIEKRKEYILFRLIQEGAPKAIFEKSTSSLRQREGQKPQKSHLYGAATSQVEILENGLLFWVDLLEGQKTGLFLDQREMREHVRKLSLNKRVLNCFSYTGSFSIAALAGGALHVDSIDISAKCGPLLEKNLQLNGLSFEKHRFFARDAIDYLIEEPLDYDLIILDPPAFAKKRQDVPKASHAYRKLNRKAFEKMPAGSLLLTCSCSSQIDEQSFGKLLFKAALESGRSIRLLGKHRQALDHPISIYHRESAYLKSFLFEIS